MVPPEMKVRKDALLVTPLIAATVAANLAAVTSPRRQRAAESELGMGMARRASGKAKIANLRKCDLFTDVENLQSRKSSRKPQSLWR